MCGGKWVGGLVEAGVADDVRGVDVEIEGEGGAGVEGSVDGQAGGVGWEVAAGEGDLVGEAAEGGGDDREGSVVLGLEGDAGAGGGEGVVGDVDDDGDGHGVGWGVVDVAGVGGGDEVGSGRETGDLDGGGAVVEGNGWSNGRAAFI